MSSKKEREEELWKREGEIAIRIVQWFDLLSKLREAAGKGVEPDDLIKQLLRADPEMLEHDYFWLMSLLTERFQLSQAQLNRRRVARVTPETYEKAWERSPNGSVSDIARRMGVSRTAIQNWLKKNPEKRLPKKK